MANPIFILDIGPDGVVATHPGRSEMPVLVAPAPDKGSDFNTIRPQLVTIACKMLPGRHFAFDSSFISPQSAAGLTKFAKLMQALQDQDDLKRFPPCSVFGHADPVGPGEQSHDQAQSDTYNKELSGRRARAVYGMLVRDVKFWDQLYENSYGGDQWGAWSVPMMLSVSLQDGEPPYYQGALEPGNDPKAVKQIRQDTSDALRAYKLARGLPASGAFDHATRMHLFLEYMDAICKYPDGTPFKLSPTDFLMQGKDPGLKGDVQGCGDFNEIVLLTADEETELAKTKDGRQARNELYKKDRRVLVYVFKHGTILDPKHWPCPRSTEGPDGCKKRFWSDYERRRKRTDQRRVFGTDMDLFLKDADGNPVLNESGEPFVRAVEDTGNTMACRWYHAFAVHSPCERAMEEWIVHLRVDSLKKSESGKRVPVPLANRRYVVLVGETNYAAEIRGRTDPNGELRIPVLDERTSMTLKLDAYDTFLAPPDSSEDNTDGGNTLSTDKFDDEDQFMVLSLDGGALRKMSDAENDLPAKQRLYNLGFGKNPPDKWTDDELKNVVKQYRRTRDVGSSDQLDGGLRETIRLEHEIEGGPPAPPSDDDDNTAPAPGGTP